MHELTGGQVADEDVYRPPVGAGSIIEGRAGGDCIPRNRNRPGQPVIVLGVGVGQFLVMGRYPGGWVPGEHVDRPPTGAGSIIEGGRGGQGVP